MCNWSSHIWACKVDGMLSAFAAELLVIFAEIEFVRFDKNPTDSEAVSVGVLTRLLNIQVLKSRCWAS